MPTSTSNAKPSREAELSALRRAVIVERRARYADFQGKRSTFSKFMRMTADRLTRRFPMEPVWVTVRALFRQYPNVDVATRISIIRRTEELIGPLLEMAEGRQEPTSDMPDIDDESGVMTGGSEPAKVRDVTKPASDYNDSKPSQEKSDRSSGPISRVSVSKSGKSYESRTQISAGAESNRNISASPTQPSLQSGNAESAAGTGSVLPSASPVSSSAPADKLKKHSNDPNEVGVQFVKGVGPKIAALLKNLGIETAADLLRHYPRKHLDFQNRLPIRQLKIGMEATVFAQIRQVSAYQSKRSNISIVNVLLSDGTGSLSITRFIGGKGNKYLLDRYKDQFPKGATVIASGVVERDKYSNKLALKNAEVEILGVLDEGGGIEDLQTQSIHLGRLVPVYALTEGLSLRYLRNVIKNALDAFGDHLEDPIPSDIREKLGLMDLRTALTNMHFPEEPENKDEARRRLVFDELFQIQLLLARRRYKFEQTEGALSIELVENGLVKRLVDNLPFTLTKAQLRVFGEIGKDLASAKPMHRLVQGDVGSGKTIVAMMACLIAVDNKFQAVVMAPTEILAEQHYKQFKERLAPLGLRVGFVVGKQGARERREVLQDIRSGQVHIAVGTHALLEDAVEFPNLGLIVIDEQHRFGVKQRARLKAKSLTPELLTMTATPIPRTLALTMHGDLDVSEIDELPPGRKPVETKLLRPSEKKQAYSLMKEQIDKGRQAYIVFPLIEESESLSAKAATQEYEKLKEGVFKEYRLGLMHGKLKPQEKDEIMDRFRKGEFQILVSTTVIEVGVDVPNSTVMMIENSDRFGLAQLHQLRGRVGRGADQSYCFLVADMKSEQTRHRLEIMEQTNDGFVVAERDLEIRGPGEFTGYRQSGLPDMILADLVKDTPILEDARNTAIELIKRDPELTSCPGLLKNIERKMSSIEGDLVRSG